MSTTATTDRQRQRASGNAQRVRRAVIEPCSTHRDAGDEPPPINPDRLGPVHATGAYAEAQRDRESAWERARSIAAAKAAAAERVTVVRCESEPTKPAR